MKAVLPFLGVPIMLVLSGCQHFERTRECRALSALVNPVLRGIDDARRGAPEAPAVYRDIGARYDTLARAVTALRPRDRRLLDASAEYVKVFHEAAHDAKTFADALESKDEARIVAARTAAQRTLRHESSALSHLDGTCRGGR